LRGPELERFLDTVSTEALVSARTILRRWPDSAEMAVRLSRVLATGRQSEYPLFADTGFMRRRLAEELAFRGHLVEAARVLGERSVPLFAELAYLGAVPAPTAQTVFSHWVRGDSSLARLTLAYWSARRDTAALIGILARVNDRAQSVAAGRNASDSSSADVRARVWYDTASIAAHLALARGDSAGALARLLVLPDTLCPECYLDRLIRARLLAAAGRSAEAVGLLEEPLVPFLTPIEVTFALERARAARRGGDRRGADAACQFVRAAWRHGDATLRSTANESCPERR
jgi:serine/threonine-protein kinase